MSTLAEYLEHSAVLDNIITHVNAHNERVGGLSTRYIDLTGYDHWEQVVSELLLNGVTMSDLWLVSCKPLLAEGRAYYYRSVQRGGDKSISDTPLCSFYTTEEYCAQIRPRTYIAESKYRKINFKPRLAILTPLLLKVLGAVVLMGCLSITLRAVL